MKKIKTLVSIVLVGSMLLGMTGCKKVKAYSTKEIKNILKDELDINRDSIYSDNFRDYDYISTTMGRVNITFMVYDDPDDAYDRFGEYYDDFEDDMDDDIFDGSQKSKISDTSGYIIFDGDVDDNGSFFVQETYYYGGVYYSDDMVALIITNSDKSSATEDVDDVLDAFGFPSL